VTQRPRVVHVVPTLDPSGAEKQLALLAAHTPKDRFDVQVIALTRGGPYEKLLADAGVPVHIVGKKMKADPFALRRLVRLLQELQPTIVQTWLFAANVYGRVAARWAKVPYVVASERCVDSWKSGLQLRLDRWLMRWTDAVAVNSEAVKEFYVHQGIARDKLHVIPNAVTPAEPVADRAALRREMGVQESSFVLGFVGRLWPQKRVDDLIWGADILRIAEWPIEVVIVGDGPRRATLERFVESMKMHGVVHFLGKREDARRLMAGFDALVLPSAFEGMPNVVLEAMAAGTPVVASRIPGTTEVVEDGKTGLLFEPKRQSDLARKVQRLLEEQGLSQRLAAAAKQVVAERFTVEAMTAGYRTLYEQLLQGRPAPARSAAQAPHRGQP
jgi:glycosyltransferase involved in cell wall biosynthesis